MSCDMCELSKTRINMVNGHGNRFADIVFIGEAPGRLEDRFGKPFVGPAGKILDSMLLSADLSRDDVFITNIVRCRPPNNRNPTDSEISICSVHLDRELDKLKPKIIVPMGTFATKYIFNRNNLNFKSIGAVHGSVKKVDDIFIYPLYHPASLIYNRELEIVMQRDIIKMGKLLSKIGKREKSENKTR